MVIDIDHPLLEKLAQDRDAGEIIAVSPRANSPGLKAHLSRGGAAIIFDGEASPPTFTLIKADRPQQQILGPDPGQTGDRDSHSRALAFVLASVLALDISVKNVIG